MSAPITGMAAPTARGDEDGSEPVPRMEDIIIEGDIPAQEGGMLLSRQTFDRAVEQGIVSGSNGLQLGAAGHDQREEQEDTERTTLVDHGTKLSHFLVSTNFYSTFASLFHASTHPRRGGPHQGRTYALS